MQSQMPGEKDRGKTGKAVSRNQLYPFTLVLGKEGAARVFSTCLNWIGKGTPG